MGKPISKTESGHMKKGPPKNQFYTIICLLLCPIIPLLFAAGCGKKTSPIPPGQTISTPVLQLTKEINNNTLILRWTIDPVNGKDIWENFAIFRSKIASDESRCNNCPILFKLIADMPITDQAEDTTGKKEMHFQEQLEEGFNYVYKVTGYTGNSMDGHDSTLVTFDF